MLLSGKVAVITGAAGVNGLGFATAKLFAEQGATIVVMDLAHAAPEKAAAALGAHHLGLVGDVTSQAQCAATIDAVVKKLGRVDILVNNAGITQPIRLLDLKPEHYDAVLDVSLRGMLYMSQAVVPPMQKQKSGSIISISSVSAQRGGGILGGPHYSAAKAGVLGLMRAIARDFGGAGIRSNAITPGLIATDINKGKIPDEKMGAILEQIPLARIGNPQDVAGAALFLASDLSRYCTGITLDVNGGMLIH
jgi:NAD(P)-dependent dehydrogenase (short-subunit alcohol dehydrogenase family)